MIFIKKKQYKVYILLNIKVFFSRLEQSKDSMSLLKNATPKRLHNEKLHKVYFAQEHQY